jgi:hypothetical protein
MYKAKKACIFGGIICNWIGREEGRDKIKAWSKMITKLKGKFILVN